MRRWLPDLCIGVFSEALIELLLSRLVKLGFHTQYVKRGSKTPLLFYREKPVQYVAGFFVGVGSCFVGGFWLCLLLFDGVLLWVI